MSPLGTPLMGRPTAGEKENTEHTEPRKRQSRLQRPSDSDIDLNFSWGDSIDEKPKDATRIFFQNTNGISAANGFVAASEVGFTSNANEVDIHCLAETNLDWEYKDTRHACNEHLRPFWPISKLVTASSTITYDSQYQPGGVATMVGGNLVGRLSNHEADSHGLGRWTTCTFRGKENTKLTIITAYQVCDDNISRNSTKTAYVQQWTLLRTVHGDLDPNPRKRFIADLDALITQLRNQGHEILLALDANESLYDTNCRIRDLTRKHKLADLHTRMHGLEGQPATYNRGQKKIDYIFGSSEVANNTLRAGITPFDSMSDHRGRSWT
jgi:hypothetical protein